MKTMMLFKLVSHFGGLLYGREMGRVFFAGTNGNSVTNLYTKNNDVACWKNDYKLHIMTEKTIFAKWKFCKVMTINLS